MSPSKRSSRRLQLETLESRTLMSASPWLSSIPEAVGPEASGAAVFGPQLPSTTMGSLAANQSPLFQVSSLQGDNTELKYGGVGKGNVKSGEIDTWYFDAKRGDKTELAWLSLQSPLQFHLYGPDGKIYSNGLNEGSGNKGYTLTMDGKYSVKVQAKPSTGGGDYRLGLERISSPSLDARHNLTFGKVVSGSITGPLQKDQYVIEGVAGQRIQLAITCSGINNNAVLFDPQGNIVGNGIMTGTVDRSFDLQHTGKYILQIQDQSLLKTGTYHVGLERISAPAWTPNTILRSVKWCPAASPGHCRKTSMSSKASRAKRSSWRLRAPASTTMPCCSIPRATSSVTAS